MAEAIAAISLTSAIVTFVDASAKVLGRLREFQSTTQEIPRVFQDIMLQLPLIIRSMTQIKEGCGSWSLTTDAQHELSDVVNGCHRQITLLKGLIETMLPSPTESTLRRARKAITSVRKEKYVTAVQKTLEGYKATLTLYLCHHSALKGRQDPKIRCRQWLRPSNVESIHRRQVRTRLHGTCDWIWINPAFVKWNEPSLSLASDRLLCIYGTPGCGKTVLASSIVEGLERKQLQTLFFSFSGADANRRNLNSLVRTLLWQLLKKTTDEQSLRIVSDLILKDPTETIELLDDLKRVAEWVTGPAYCVIDGVDECDDSIQELLDFVFTLLEPRANFRVALLGRPHALQAAISATTQTIEMNSSLVKQDIDAFIDSEIGNSSDLNIPELRDSIFNTLQEKSDGMFLWVKLMVDDLRKAATPSEIVESLHNLPRGLGKAYRRVFLRLTRTLNDSELARARKILAFAIVSCRPLELDELRYAYALDLRSGSTFEEHLLLRPVQGILEVCGDFISITDGLVQLIHISIKEFLTRPEEEWLRSGDQDLLHFRVDLVASHRTLGSLCVDYLRMSEYRSPLHDADAFLGLHARYPFLRYASMNMVSHLTQSGPPCSTTLGKLKDFLGSKNCISWIEYLAMLLLEDGSIGTLGGEFEAFTSWLNKGGHERELFEKELHMCLNRELAIRNRTFGEYDPRTEQWRIFLDIILNKVASTDSDHKPTNRPLWVTPSLSHILNTFSSNPALPLHRQADMLLRLQYHLQRTRVLTDPLKMLFRAVLQKAPTIPVYVLLVIGAFYCKLDKLEETLEVYRAALTKLERQEIPIRCEILGWTAHILGQLGKYEESEEMHRRALEVREKVLGNQHRDTLANIWCLGNVLNHQGKHEEAEEMYRRVLEGRDKVLGKEHYDTVDSAQHLSTILHNRGKYEEAEEMCRRALDGQEKALGKEHLKTLATARLLGALLDTQGKHGEAEEVCRRVLEGRETVLGKEHWLTLTSVNSLGIALENQGKHQEAEEMYRRALGGREKTLGKEHRDTLTSANNLGISLYNQGKCEEAEVVYRRALEKALREEHYGTLTSADNLGTLLENYRRVLGGREQALRFQYCGARVCGLGSALHKQGKCEKAENAYGEALEGKGRDVSGQSSSEAVSGGSNSTAPGRSSQNTSTEVAK